MRGRGGRGIREWATSGSGGLSREDSNCARERALCLGCFVVLRGCVWGFAFMVVDLGLCLLILNGVCLYD